MPDRDSGTLSSWRARVKSSDYDKRQPVVVFEAPIWAWALISLPVIVGILLLLFRV